MENTLSPENIAYIHRKLKSRGVVHIDLQYELTDHIATAIEEKFEEGTPFQAAFDEVMETFGRCGISKLQQEKTNKLRKQSKIVVWQYIKSYFKIPKIILTVLIILGFTSLYSINSNYEFYFKVFWAIYVAINISLSVFIFTKYRKRRFSQLEPVNYILGIIGLIPLYLFNFREIFFFNALFCILFSSVFTLLMIVTFELYMDVSEELTKRYQYIFQ